MYDVKFGSTDGLGDYMRDIDDQKQSMRERKQRLRMDRRRNKLLNKRTEQLMQAQVVDDFYKNAKNKAEYDQNIAIRLKTKDLQDNKYRVDEALESIIKAPVIGTTQANFTGQRTYKTLDDKIDDLQKFESSIIAYTDSNRYGETGNEYKMILSHAQTVIKNYIAQRQKEIKQQESKEATQRFMDNVSIIKGISEDVKSVKLGDNTVTYQSKNNYDALKINLNQINS